MKRTIQPILVLAAAVLLNGCMGYRLGGTGPEGVETVHLAPVINRTTEPAIELEVTRALRSRIQYDGRLVLVNGEDQADAVIEAVLTDYRLTPIAYRSEQRTTPELYRLRITVHAELKDRETGEVISSSQTYGEATFPFQADLTSSKRDALPRAAKEIARFVTDDLIEQW